MSERPQARTHATLDLCSAERPGAARQYVAAGWYGRKAGRGFYTYLKP